MNDTENSTKKEEEKKFKNKVTVWVTLIGIIVFIIFLSFCFSSRPQSPEDIEQNKQVEAFVRSQFVVEEYLKAPSTAKFPSFTDNGVIVSKLSADEYLVTAYVDSENSFGAMIRTTYQVVIISVGEDEYRYESLYIDE